MAFNPLAPADNIIAQASTFQGLQLANSNTTSTGGSLGAATEYVMIDNFIIDVSLTENHSFESDVTEYPVESGSDVTDNIRPKPITVTMEGIVSNSPIGVVATLRDSDTPVNDAYAELIRVRDNRLPVTITTSLDTFTNMALKHLSIPRDRGSAQYLHFTAEFVQITMVENVREIRTSTPLGKGGNNTTKAPVPTPLGSHQYGDYYNIITPLNLWYDINIHGWRESFVSSKQGQIDSDSVSDNNKQFADTTATYLLYKGRPYGVTNASFSNDATKKTDAQYRAMIDALHAEDPEDPTYNPFVNPLDGSSTNLPVTTVRGKIQNQVFGPQQ